MGGDQGCLSMNKFFADDSDDVAQQLVMVNELSKRISEDLASSSSEGAAMVTQVLKFMFSPAKDVPFVGSTLYGMLESAAEYTGNNIENQFRNFLLKMVHKFMQTVVQHSREVKESHAGTVETFKFIFQCTDIADDFSALVDNLTHMGEGLEAKLANRLNVLPASTKL